MTAKKPPHYKCKKCGSQDHRITDSRLVSSSPHFKVRRRRECLSCGYRFTTYEVPWNTKETE